MVLCARGLDRHTEKREKREEERVGGEGGEREKTRKRREIHTCRGKIQS